MDIVNNSGKWQSGQLQQTVNLPRDALRRFESFLAHQKQSFQFAGGFFLCAFGYADTSARCRCDRHTGHQRVPHQWLQHRCQGEGTPDTRCYNTG